MSDYRAQSDFEKADEVLVTAVGEFLILDLLPVLTNAVAKPTEHLEAQLHRWETILSASFPRLDTFEISASSASGAERGTGSGALQTHRGWMLRRIMNGTYCTAE